jgi:hypothetical protein
VRKDLVCCLLVTCLLHLGGTFLIRVRFFEHPSFICVTSPNNIIRSQERLLGANAQGLSPTNHHAGTPPYSASCKWWPPLLSIHYQSVTLGPIANGNPGLECTRTLCGFILWLLTTLKNAYLRSYIKRTGCDDKWRQRLWQNVCHPLNSLLFTCHHDARPVQCLTLDRWKLSFLL